MLSWTLSFKSLDFISKLWHFNDLHSKKLFLNNHIIYLQLFVPFFLYLTFKISLVALCFSFSRSVSNDFFIEQWAYLKEDPNNLSFKNCIGLFQSQGWAISLRKKLCYYRKYWLWWGLFQQLFRYFYQLKVN